MPDTDLALLDEDRAAVIEYNARQVDLIRRMYAKDVTPDEFAVFLEVSKRTGLNPFNKQIYIIPRGSGDNRTATIQVAIDGYRVIASRAGGHEGTRIQWAKGDGIWSDIPFHDCEYAKATVIRNGAEFEKIVAYTEYVQTKPVWESGAPKGSKPIGQEPTEMWVKMRANQLGKCAEAGALRMAFPAEMSGIFVDSEEAAMQRVADLEESRRLLAAPRSRSGNELPPANRPANRPSRSRQDAPPPADEGGRGEPAHADGWGAFWNELSAVIKEREATVSTVTAALNLGDGAGINALKKWFEEHGSDKDDALDLIRDALEAAS